jgi:two-component system, OmpR family, osmolarity sensor histidine kinase EnvZ
VQFIRTLNRMNSALNNMEDDRAMMLAGISHDLRTPVTRIQLALEMIGGDFDADLKTRVLTNLAEIESGLNQCLYFARNIEDETPKLVDLNDLARLCAASYKANGHDITLDLCDEAQTLMRPFAMQRLLKNLIDNAIKYANNEITIATQRTDGKLILSVLDRGAGIADADIEKLRRPFMRADIARADAKGYGLGLAIVDKIVEAHQAKISFFWSG